MDVENVKRKIKIYCDLTESCVKTNVARDKRVLGEALIAYRKSKKVQSEKLLPFVYSKLQKDFVEKTQNCIPIDMWNARMGSGKIRFNEAILMKVHKFVIGSWLGIRDASYLLKAVEEGREVVYQVDFNVLHPYIFPYQTKRDIERDTQSYHGIAMKCLWDLMFSFDDPNWEDNFFNLPFKLAMSPATRLEVLEALWHTEKRMYKKFRKYTTPIMPHIKFTKNYVQIPNREKLYKILTTSDYKNFLPKLHEAVSDEALKHDLKKPVDSLTLLLESKAIQNLEEYLPEHLLKGVKEKGYPHDIEMYTKKLYTHRHRVGDSESWVRSHDEFHDRVDEVSIALAYSLAKTDTKEGFYIPVLSHTGRLINVGTALMDYSKCLLVNHTLAPLYIMKGTKERPKEDLASFINSGKALITRIASEMRQIDELEYLLTLNAHDLKDRLQENNEVDIPDSLMEKLQMFSTEYYNLIDGPTNIPTEKEPERELLPKSITIKDIVDLFGKAIQYSEGVRSGADTIRQMFDKQSCVLAGIFGALGSHVQEVYSWLSDHETIDFSREFE